MINYLLLLLVVFVPSLIVSGIFKRRKKKYSETRIHAGLSGREVAEKMLRENGIYDVQVVTSDSMLTDYYDPRNKTINLSSDIYNGVSVFSAAVAAHECGHAVQHQNAYAPLKLRTAMVPVVTFSSQLVFWIILAGMLLMKVFPQLMLFGIILFGIITAFSFITLPVEINASQRAKLWLQASGLTSDVETVQVRDALGWAAMTYVVAALASLANLFYYIMIYMGGRR